MKKSNKRHFIEQLKKQIEDLGALKTGEIHVITVNANYGRYKLVVGPIKDQQNYPIEIDGEIHHLFVSPKAITPNPSKKEVQENLKHSVIMKDLEVHLNDPNGDGHSLRHSRCKVEPKEYINFAGQAGKEMLNSINSHGRLSNAAYRIIQDDIIRSMKKRRSRPNA
ncbi:MAG: hypothetical protein ABH859_03035 [Pseudomonadota bacterium]